VLAEGTPSGTDWAAPDASATQQGANAIALAAAFKSLVAVRGKRTPFFRFITRCFLSDTQQLLDPFAKTGSGQAQSQLDNIQTWCFMQGGDKHLFYAHSADLFADPLGMPR